MSIKQMLSAYLHILILHESIQQTSQYPYQFLEHRKGPQIHQKLLL